MQYTLLKTNKQHTVFIVRGNILVARCQRDVSKKNWYVFTMTKKVRHLSAVGAHPSPEDALDAYTRYQDYRTGRKVKTEKFIRHDP